MDTKLVIALLAGSLAGLTGLRFNAGFAWLCFLSTFLGILWWPDKDNK
jgi:hypothetical protein